MRIGHLIHGPDPGGTEALLVDLARVPPGAGMSIAALALTPARDLGDPVRFLGHRDDVPGLLAAGDVVAHPSEAGALPTALPEAFAAGRPIVATPVGGIPEIVTPEVGVLVPPGSPAALAADPSHRAAPGAAARARFDTHTTPASGRTASRRSTPRSFPGRPPARARGGRAGRGRRRAAAAMGEGLDVLPAEFAPSGRLFRSAYQEGAALAARGHRVELVTGPWPELPDGVPGMRVVPLLPTWHPHAGAAAPVLVRRARRCVRAVRYVAARWRPARHVRARRDAGAAGRGPGRAARGLHAAPCARHPAGPARGAAGAPRGTGGRAVPRADLRL